MSLREKIRRKLRRLERKPDDVSLQDDLWDLWEEDPEGFSAAIEEGATDAPGPARQVPPWNANGLERATWSDCIDVRKVQPLRLFHPRTRAHLVHILQRAAADGRKVRAAGSGHSFTDVATTNDFMVSTHGLNSRLALDTSVLKDPAHADRFFEVEGGIVVHDLNDLLFAAGKALVNMSAFDGQTIAGAIATGTHGTGLKYGPMADHVRSMVMVGEGGKVYRLEPKIGITDAAAHQQRYPDVTLIQEDDAFYSALVCMGSFGIIYSLTLEVLSRYFLSEVRTLSNWSAVKADLAKGDVLRRNRHYGLLLNPYVVDDPRTGFSDRACLVTTRNEHPGPASRGKRYSTSVAIGNLFAGLPRQVMQRHPDRVPRMLNTGLLALRTREVGGAQIPFVDQSYRVHNFGGRMRLHAFALDVAFPLDNCVAGIDEMLSLIAKRRDQGRQFCTAPISIRFTGPSRAYLAPQHDRQSCMVEPPMMEPTTGGAETLIELQRASYKHDGRPHWGLEVGVTGNDGLLEKMYPKHAAWLAQFRRFNAKGTFVNTFTERCGFDV